MKLNDQQEVAADHLDGPCLCTAVPGSGKTRVIVERTARMIAKGVAPSSILCITFTNKAAAEMKERVEKRIGDVAKRIFISTFHRLSSTILRHHGHHIGYDRNMTILDEDDQVSLMLQIGRQLEFELTRPAVKRIVWQTNDWRENLGDDDDLYDRFDDIEEPEWARIAFEYIKRTNASNQIDFSGMLSETHRLLKNFPQVLQSAQNKWKYFMVDEVQDTNLAQFKIVDLLCSHTKNIFIVGDGDQCQPAGTKVLTSRHGEVNIEDLDPNVHRLVSFSTRASAVLGRKYGLDFKTSSREFVGRIHIVIADGHKTRCTPNHKWTVKLKKDTIGKYHLVYLMRSGRYWRVGHTNAFRSYGPEQKGAFGPIMRARQEKADAVWVLRVCESACEAQLWEQILSCRYGIPTTCFTSGKCMLPNLDVLYKELPLTEPSAENCLFAHGLEPEHPLWQKNGIYSPDFGKRIPLLVHAANLIPEIMQIPVPREGKDFEWSDFSVESELFSGKVYSLDVGRHKHYIADGIITHNSIYGWRGARMENLNDFKKNYGAKVISLGKNYRSTPQIIAAADKLIRHNAERIEVSFSTDNPSGVPVHCQSFQTDLQEAEAVATTIKDIIASGRYTPKDIAVFYRMNSMSRAIEMAMISKKVPHSVIGNFSFYDRKEIKDCLAMLRFLVNPKDGIAFHRIANKPKRGLGDTTIGKIELYAKDNDMTLIQAMKNMVFTSQSVRDGIGEVLNAYDFDPSTLSVPQCIARLVEKLNYEQYLKDEDEEGQGADRIDSVQELIKSAAREVEEKGYSVADYLDHIALMTSADKAEDGEVVSLMSLHASKGLEFPVVFMLGVEQNILPHKKAVDERVDGIEEERRLCYVGMTRAKNVLSMSYCQRRQDGFAATKGKVNYKQSTPSQFLVESGLLKALPKPKEAQSFHLSGGRQGQRQTVWDHMA